MLAKRATLILHTRLCTALQLTSMHHSEGSHCLLVSEPTKSQCVHNGSNGPTLALLVEHDILEGWLDSTLDQEKGSFHAFVCP